MEIALYEKNCVFKVNFLYISYFAVHLNVFQNKHLEMFYLVNHFLSLFKFFSKHDEWKNVTGAL